MIKILNKNFDPEQIEKSGQIFRMKKTENDLWKIISKKYILRLSQKDGGVFLDCSKEDFEKYWKNYFDLDYNYQNIIEKVISGNDNYLKEAVKAGSGIRILRQDPFEMVISFIISQQMQIPRIRKLIEALCHNYGEKLSEDDYSFPSSKALAEANIADFRAMGFGYRSEYISLAAKAVEDKKIDLEIPYKMNYEDCIKYFMQLRGVGKKVANCISLFAYHKIDAFPIDTWIKKVITNIYNGNFDITQYKGYEGIIQQYIYYYERLRSGSIK